MIRRLLAPLVGRRLALATLVLAQALLAFTLAAAMALPVFQPLARHPEGYFALFDEGGRLALDLYRTQRAGLLTALALAAALVSLYALAWTFLGAVLPALCITREAPPLHRAAAFSLRKMPTLLALALMAIAGYAVAATTAAFGWSYGVHKAALLIDERRGDLQRLYFGVLPPLFLAGLVATWHDVARVHVVGDGVTAGGAAVAALRRVLGSPLRTLGSALGFAALGHFGLALGIAATLAWGHHASALAVLALTALQQFVLAWRMACRTLWFAWLAAPWREGAHSSGSPPRTEP